jgi:hypothetical protein
MQLRTGGAVNLDSPYTWSETSGAFLDVPPSDAALDILDYLGVDLTAFPSTSGPGTPTNLGLAGYLLFPREEWGTDSVQRVRGLPGEANNQAEWQAFVNRLPYSQAAKDAIVRIQTDTTTDWIALTHGAGMTPEQRVHLLTTISYRQWLMDYLGAPEEAIREELTTVRFRSAETPRAIPAGAALPQEVHRATRCIPDRVHGAHRPSPDGLGRCQPRRG